jgi:hypothetical protein
MGTILAPAIVPIRVMTLDCAGAATMRRHEEIAGGLDVG